MTKTLINYLQTTQIKYQDIKFLIHNQFTLTNMVKINSAYIFIKHL